MNIIRDIKTLEALYGSISDAATRKVARSLTPLYHEWIMKSRLCVLSTVGPDGTDATPRGDDGPVVQVLDKQRLALPDWRGNNRLDSMKNIIMDPRVSLMFITAGSNETVRVNGRGAITDDPELRATFEKKGLQPSTVLIIEIEEVYIHCSRALLRAGIWQRDDRKDLPSMGRVLSEMTKGDIEARAFDDAWPERAKSKLW